MGNTYPCQIILIVIYTGELIELINTLNQFSDDYPSSHLSVSSSAMLKINEITVAFCLPSYKVQRTFCLGKTVAVGALLMSFMAGRYLQE